MPVDVQYATRSAAPDAESIQRWAEAALEAASTSDLPCGSGLPAAKPAAAPTAVRGELCVRVVDEEESRRLNRDYRHKDAPTNVLSFPADIDLPDVLIWGDLVVCAPVVAGEAADQHKQYEDHFAHMVVHGVLHLLGYDHQAADEAAVMEQLEARILDRFAVNDPYGEG